MQFAGLCELQLTQIRERHVPRCLRPVGQRREGFSPMKTAIHV
jgi:hypothetical protein